VDPETAVIHFWSPGGVRRRPQRVASGVAAAATAAATTAAIAVLLRLLLVLLYSQFGNKN